VPVGDYRLEERISSSAGETGKSLGYDFNIYGEGNISAIEKPTVQKGQTFDFFEPNVKQSVNRDNGRVTGTKTFSYFIIPQEPGQFNLKDYVRLVYFNPKRKTYDTLKSKVGLAINGESKKNDFISSSDGGSFYDRISLADNILRSTKPSAWIKMGFSALAVVMIGVSVWLVFKK